MELLKKLYSIYSKSRKEENMLDFLINYVWDTEPTAEVDMDKLGNLYITKGKSETYPCVVAHVDQVQDEHSDDFMVVETEDIIFGYSRSKRTQQGLGADDKNGIWVGLKCLHKYDAIKLAFFVGEEIGCVGSRGANMAFFEDCRFVLQCDRRGYDDLITEASCTELCSDEFEKATCASVFGYSKAHGMMTDVMTLKENGLKVSCLNISCGYYQPHTNNEFTVKSDLQNCLEFVQFIIENCLAVYPHEYVYKPLTNSYGYGYNTRYNDNGWYDSNGVWHSYYTGQYNKRKEVEKPKPKVEVKGFGEKKEAQNKTQKKTNKKQKQEKSKESDGAEVSGISEDEIYDLMYELMMFCENATFDMIYSAIKHTYPNIKFSELILRSIYGEVKFDLKVNRRTYKVGQSNKPF